MPHEYIINNCLLHILDEVNDLCDTFDIKLTSNAQIQDIKIKVLSSLYFLKRNSYEMFFPEALKAICFSFVRS